MKEQSMRGVSLKSVLVSGVVFAALMLTGCGLQVREITLLENIEVPTLETLGEDADPGWIEYLDLESRLVDNFPNQRPRTH